MPGPVGLQIGPVDIFGLTVDAEDHFHVQLLFHRLGKLLAELHQSRGLLFVQQKNLPGGISQNDASLGPDGHIHQVLHLLQKHLALQGAGVPLPVPGGDHNAPSGNPDVDAHGKAPFGQCLRIIQAGAQNPVLQEPALDTLIQLAAFQDHSLPDEDLRHFFHDLAVFDDLDILAGNADDALNLPVHLNGQVDAPADIGKLPLQLRGDVVFAQVILNDSVGTGMKIAYPGVVIAGNDPTGFVHQVDILLDQLADFFHDLLGTALGDFHLGSSGITFPLHYILTLYYNYSR